MIKTCKKQGDKTEEDGWMAYLSPNKQKGLHQLFRRKRLTAKLDALLDFPGLWAGLEIGNIETHLALRCDEVSGKPVHSRVETH